MLMSLSKALLGHCLKSQHDILNIWKSHLGHLILTVLKLLISGGLEVPDLGMRDAITPSLPTDGHVTHWSPLYNS